jgi:alanyl aminopeptidase
MIPRFLRAAMAAALFCAVAVCAHAEDAADQRLGFDVMPRYQSIRLHLDPDKRSYTGEVRVDLDVVKSTNIIRLHADGQKLTRVTLLQGADTIAVERANGTSGLLTLTAAKPLKTGAAKLEIAFTHMYGTRAVGMYRVVKENKGYLFTQFEDTDARQAFPCWDEPCFKFPYQFTLEVPAKQECLTNTPVLHESTAEGWKTIEYAKTPPLPSYLLALAVGPFEFTPIPGMRIPTRIVTVQGQSRLTGTLVKETPALFNALERWFGIPYAFDKLDLIAVPDFAYGAMENPGAITYRDDILLVDPNTLTPGQLRRMDSVHAHEMAHQWFGDLVTMAWWDDLWLNESFADWMAQKIVDEVHPELRAGLDQMNSGQRTKNSDATPSTQAIRSKIGGANTGLQNVGLVYNKGCAMLSMFENWMGPETFRKGVQNYLKAHARGNAVANDLWVALDQASGRKVSPAMATFTDQPGVPYLRVVPAPGGVRVTQSRASHFGVSQDPMTWKIPVAFKYSDGKSVHTTSALIEQPSQIVSLPGASTIDWVIPDAGGQGYYAWSVPQDMLVRIGQNARAWLTPAERVSFVGNLNMLLDMGEVHGDGYLAALSNFGNDSEPQVVSSVIEQFGGVRQAFVPDSAKSLFARYVRHTLAPTLERVGYEKKMGEDEIVSTIRPQLITWLATRGEDEKTLAWAQAAGKRYLTDSTSVDPGIADVVVQMAARKGDKAMFDDLQKRFEAATVPALRRRYLSALGAFADTTLESRMLNYILTDKVLPSETFTPFMGFANKDDAAGLRLWHWLTENYATVAAHVPPPALRFLPMLGGGGCDEARLKRVTEFFSDPARGIPGIDRTLQRVADNTHDCLSLRSREARSVQAYFQTLP